MNTTSDEIPKKTYDINEYMNAAVGVVFTQMQAKKRFDFFG